MQEALVVRRDTYIPAPRAAVFAFLTDPEKILGWMGTEAQVEPSPAAFTLSMLPVLALPAGTSARWCRAPPRL
jgi:hypothetical protein